MISEIIFSLIFITSTNIHQVHSTDERVFEADEQPQDIMTTKENNDEWNKYNNYLSNFGKQSSNLRQLKFANKPLNNIEVNDINSPKNAPIYRRPLKIQPSLNSEDQYIDRISKNEKQSDNRLCHQIPNNLQNYETMPVPLNFEKNNYDNEPAIEASQTGINPWENYINYLRNIRKPNVQVKSELDANKQTFSNIEDACSSNSINGIMNNLENTPELNAVNLEQDNYEKDSQPVESANDFNAANDINNSNNLEALTNSNMLQDYYRTKPVNFQNFNNKNKLISNNPIVDNYMSYLQSLQTPKFPTTPDNNNDNRIDDLLIKADINLENAWNLYSYYLKNLQVAISNYEYYHNEKRSSNKIDSIKEEHAHCLFPTMPSPTTPSQQNNNEPIQLNNKGIPNVNKAWNEYINYLKSLQKPKMPSQEVKCQCSRNNDDSNSINTKRLFNNSQKPIKFKTFTSTEQKQNKPKITDLKSINNILNDDIENLGSFPMNLRPIYIKQEQYIVRYFTNANNSKSNPPKKHKNLKIIYTIPETTGQTNREEINNVEQI